MVETSGSKWLHHQVKELVTDCVSVSVLFVTESIFLMCFEQ